MPTDIFALCRELDRFVNNELWIFRSLPRLMQENENAPGIFSALHTRTYLLTELVTVGSPEALGPLSYRMRQIETGEEWLELRAEGETQVNPLPSIAFLPQILWTAACVAELASAGEQPWDQREANRAFFERDVARELADTRRQREAATGALPLPRNYEVVVSDNAVREGLAAFAMPWDP